MRTHPHYNILFKKLKDALMIRGLVDELQILEFAIKQLTELKENQASNLQLFLKISREAIPAAYIHDIFQGATAMAAEIRRLQRESEAYKKFIAEMVEPLRHEAMEVSLKYEPCGYYCDPDVGHVDHRLHNHAKYLYGAGDGKTYSIPNELLPESLQEKPSKPGERF